MEYILRYLPIAKQDLSDAISFIMNEFQNPIAAENTLNKIEKAIMDRLEDGPESFAIWPSTKKREYPYRRKLFVIKKPQAKNLRPTNLK